MSRTRYVAVLAIAALAAGWVAMADRTPSALADFGAATAQEADASAVTEMALGAEDAPVTVIEYASFTCPHCATFHETNWPRLKADYIDTGKVRFIYREVYFDRPGLWAGMVARCGGEDSYFGFADVLYETQKEWIGGGEPQEIADNLRRLGRTAGLSDDEINACLNDQEKAQALFAAYQENADRDQIRSTPSFVIDGQTYGNMPWDEFSTLLDDKIGG